MNDIEFREFGKAVIDYIADYNQNLRDRNVLPEVDPGYLMNRIPTEAPKQPESWRQVLDDVEKHIMPGITHWQSPHFHAYYPTGNSYPSIVGEILSAGIACVGFSWIASPACTELEMITMDWLAKLLGLPEEFLNSSSGSGGGVIQGSASEATLVGLLTAREKAVSRLKKKHPDWEEGFIRSKLISYSSDQSNSSVEKSGRLGAVMMKLLPTDKTCSMRGATLLEQIKKDLEAGFIPCYVVATLGTTPTCAFDNLNELGPICNKYNIWLHIDAAYAGAAFVCPEYRYLMSGIQYADSFNFNPHKWLLVNFDCSALWMKDSQYLIDAFNVDRIYLPNNKFGVSHDYRHWQIPLGRRFRALKLWFVLRLYGAEGLQKHIRHTVELLKKFEELIKTDDRFEIPVEAKLGLICFRIKGKNDLTKQLIDRLMARRKLYILPGTYHEQLVIRFVICSRFSLQEDILFAWNEISNQTTEVLLLNTQFLAVKQEFNISSMKSSPIMSRIKELEIVNKNLNSV